MTVCVRGTTLIPSYAAIITHKLEFCTFNLNSIVFAIFAIPHKTDLKYQQHFKLVYKMDCNYFSSRTRNKDVQN